MFVLLIHYFERCESLSHGVKSENDNTGRQSIHSSCITFGVSSTLTRPTRRWHFSPQRNKNPRECKGPHFNNVRISLRRMVSLGGVGVELKIHIWHMYRAWDTCVYVQMCNLDEHVKVPGSMYIDVYHCVGSCLGQVNVYLHTCVNACTIL